MKVIHKFNVDDRDIYVPKNSKVLCVKVQNNIPKVWILIDINDGDTSLKQFEIIGTGQEFDDTYRIHVGTYFEDIFVWHVFEVI